MPALPDRSSAQVQGRLNISRSLCPQKAFLFIRKHANIVYGLSLSSAARCRPVFCTQARKLVTSSTSFHAILRSTRSLGMGVSPTHESKKGKSAFDSSARGEGQREKKGGGAGGEDGRVNAVRTIHSILPDSTLRTLSTLT